MAAWSEASCSSTAGPMISTTLWTAWRTPLPL